MKKLAGVLLMILGIALGAWIGVWWMFIGGIVQIIDAAKATPVESLGIAVGLLKALLAWPVGWLSIALLCIPGYVMVRY